MPCPLTVTVQFARRAPLTVVAVITASPAFNAVTTPLLTIATLSLEVVHITFLLDAFSGRSSTAKTSCSPRFKLALVALMSIPVTSILLTVTVQVAVKPPSVVFAVMVAVPFAFAVTTPVTETSATLLSELVQVTRLLSASAGATVALSCAVSLTSKLTAVLSSETPVTAIFSGSGGVGGSWLSGLHATSVVANIATRHTTAKKQSSDFFMFFSFASALAIQKIVQCASSATT